MRIDTCQFLKVYFPGSECLVLDNLAVAFSFNATKRTCVCMAGFQEPFDDAAS